jgi:hypothetical protein
MAPTLSCRASTTFLKATCDLSTLPFAEEHHCLPNGMKHIPVVEPDVDRASIPRES